MNKKPRLSRTPQIQRFGEGFLLRVDDKGPRWTTDDMQGRIDDDDMEKLSPFKEILKDWEPDWVTDNHIKVSSYKASFGSGFLAILYGNHLVSWKFNDARVENFPTISMNLTKNHSETIDGIFAKEKAVYSWTADQLTLWTLKGNVFSVDKTRIFEDRIVDVTGNHNRVFVCTKQKVFLSYHWSKFQSVGYQGNSW